MKKSLQALLAALLLSVSGGLRPASADIITDWNSQILQAIDSSSEAPPYAARDMAILHIAMYNAMESITNSFEVYQYGSYTGPTGTAPLGADISAAATSAAYTVLQNLYPALSGPGSAIETQYNNHLATLGASQSVTDGITWGQSVANQVYSLGDPTSWRFNDGASGAQTPYTVSGLGHWQPTPPAFNSQPLLPSWGSVTPFAIASTVSVMPPTPGSYNPGDPSTTTLSAIVNAEPGADVVNYLQTSAYAADYNQVKNLGSATSLTRTADQTDIAYFWAAGSGTITPPGMWNEIAQSIATDPVHGFNFTLEQNARLFAALNTAMADAGIAAWHAKYEADFWRPVTAIAFESDPFAPNPDNNPLTGGEAGWTPLLTTPSFPEYVSGHSTFSAAAGSVLAAIFGDNVSFTAESDIFGDGTVIMTRGFNSFSEAVDEAGMSRIYGGIHFESANADGQAIGEAVGDEVMGNFFQPVPEPSGALLIAAAGLATILRRRMGR